MMDKMRFFIFYFLFFIVQIGNAQISIHGQIIDSESKQSLPGAVIIFLPQGKQTASDAQGNFNLNVTVGKGTLSVQFIGYEKQEMMLNLVGDTTLELSLQKSQKQIQEVRVEAENLGNLSPTSSEAIKLKPVQIEQLPALMGESDLLRALTSMPGIKQIEGNQGILIRGGSQDQNLLLFDDAVIYNSSHLLGFFSVFNTQAIRDVSLYKSAIPAAYGGRLSGLMNVEASGGSMSEWKRHLSLGLLAANAMISGPIKHDTCSFSFSGRRTYIDKLMLPLVKKVLKSSEFDNSEYYFQDYTAKIIWKPTKNNKIELSAYSGNDLFAIRDINNEWSNEISWSNKATSLRWRHRFNERCFMQHSFALSNYSFGYNIVQQMYNLDLKTGITTARSSASFVYKNDRWNYNVGYDAQYHYITPNNIRASVKDFALNLGENVHLSALETAQYIEAAYLISEKWNAVMGIRLSEFAHLGPFKTYNSTQSQLLRDSTLYNNNDIVAWFLRPEPRALIQYKCNALSQARFSIGRTIQYLHFVPIISSALPAEIWLPSTSNLLPQTAWQAALGYEYDYSWFHGSIDGYYKKMDELSETRSASFNLYGNQNNYSEMLYRGQGYAWGFELLLQKKTGRFTGGVSYVYSRSLRQFPDINSGRVFPAKYDRPHDFSCNFQYEVSRIISLSLTFVYYSGVNMTMPVARYVVEGSLINQYGDKNGYRFPAYHRADIAIKYAIINRPKVKSNLTLSVANLYNRLNPYYTYYDVNGDISKYQLEVKKHDVYLFPILPSLTWSIDF